MSTAVADTSTMLRRNLLHLRRYPSLTAIVVGLPVVLLLLMVYVFGGTLGAGLPGGVDPGTAGRSAYLAYVTPAVLMLAVVAVAQGTAITMAMDMTGGLVARFKSMAVTPGAILGGHAIGAVLQSLAAIVISFGVAVALGFRPSAGAAQYAVLLGLLTLVSLAVTWLSVALGMSAGSVEEASNTPMVLVLLPFLSSGFVPVDSMPSGLAWFAEHQPFTPILESVRALLDGSSPGSDLVIALGWCVLVIGASHVWSLRLFRRERPIG